MTGKFVTRSLRTAVSSRKPYFAHLAITHRCNLKCRFCHVTETRFAELDTESTKRMIDVLDRMGVAVISISGGGEPLLREDFDQIINHAAARGLYVKLTSNGTMPRAKYERLLRSGVEEIGISLDGVRGHDLPFSHVGSPILETLRYLHDNLPRGKKLTINVTISEDNRGQTQEILNYCATHYPRARVWLNPVITGEGALRTSGTVKTEPDYLRTCHSPTLLSANFYNDAADQYYRDDSFNWGCLAGDQLFDIKPNGDFWLCQDQPSPVPLNVLDPEFDQKRKQLDKSARRNCAGCVYSCYYVVQNSFRPRNWPDVAKLWWDANTEPGGAERHIAGRFGWLAGLASLIMPRLAQRVAMALTMFLLLFLAQGGGLRAASPALSPETVLDRMERAGRWQHDKLDRWTSIRVYSAANNTVKKSARAKIQIDFFAPGHKTYRVLEQWGSPLVLKHAIIPVVEAECKSAEPAVRALADIQRANYDFHWIGFDSQENAYVFEAAPRARGRYQFRGRIWVDAASFGIARVKGSPAVSPSFWVKRTEFAHEYRRFGPFWLPVSHNSRARLRIFGLSTLEIDYQEYQRLPHDTPLLRQAA